MIEQWACSNKLAYLRKERRRQDGRKRYILQWQFGGCEVVVRGSSAGAAVGRGNQGRVSESKYILMLSTE